MPCSYQGLFIWSQILHFRLIQQKTGKHSCVASLWLVCLALVCKTAAHVSALLTEALVWLTNTLLHFQPPSCQFTGHITGWFSFSQTPEDTLLSDFLTGFIPMLAMKWVDMSLFLHPHHSGIGLQWKGFALWGVPAQCYHADTWLALGVHGHGV